MKEEKKTNWKKLYISLLVVTFAMMVAMLLFQNYYK
ncbi:cytoskeletal protein RodZ [Chryseobacterium sp. MP_3.2]|nr:cytoskeletal protein RodZ [Chryseobacterium sp. MP_3.2]